MMRFLAKNKAVQNLLRVELSSSLAQCKEIVNSPRLMAKRQMHSSEPILSGLNQAKCAIKDYPLISEDEKRVFESVYPEVIDNLLYHAKKSRSPGLIKHIENMLHYNVGTGTNFRGLAAAKIYKLMAKPEHQTAENIKRSNILGWLVEVSGASVSMHDDMVDGSQYRRGTPSWYTKKENGLNCINDVLVLNSWIYTLLSKYFQDRPCYKALINTCNEVHLNSNLGYVSDGMPLRRDDPWDLFTLDQFLMKIRMSTGYCSFFWGVQLGLHFADVTDPNVIAQSREVMLQMGDYYQCQNDYLDCFHVLDRTGKIPNDDIRAKKVTWFAITAMKLASPEQLKVFKENYGKNDSECVKTIHQIYSDLNIKQQYEEFLNGNLQRIQDNIKKFPAELPQQFYLDLLDHMIHADPL